MIMVWVLALNDVIIAVNLLFLPTIDMMNKYFNGGHIDVGRIGGSQWQ